MPTPRPKTFYNEIDPFCCAWLSNLMDAGAITPGVISDTPIQNFDPKELRGYERAHFFAGIGIWDYALNQAGWRDDGRSLWTGSCPCPSFSAAGKGKGFDDARHLWPAWARLIRECKPATIFGEQVDDAIGFGWLDLVQTDLEREAYAVGKAVFGACSVGAPQIGSRLYFVAEAASSRRQETGEYRSGLPLLSARPEQRSGLSSMASPDGRQSGDRGLQRSGKHGLFAEDSGAGELEQAERRRCEQRDAGERPVQKPDQRSATDGMGAAPERGFGVCGSASRNAGRITQPKQARELGAPERERLEGHSRDGNERDESRWLSPREDRSASEASPLGGFWRDAEWLYCTDGKYRPTQPIAQQMADGDSESMGPLCASRTKKIEEEISEAAKRYEADPGKAVFDVWRALHPEAIRQWTRGLHSVYEAPVLLALLRQLTEQGWAFSESVSRARKKAQEERMRIVREQESIACSPRGRGLDEQQTGEPTDLVRVLSSILARHAQEAWSEAFDTNARDAFPLAVGVVNRVGTLRGYGNALCAPQAAEFIKAYMETQDA